MSVKAVLFDVDGTLYDQRLMRKQMLKDLIELFFKSPVKGGHTIYILYQFRKLREFLRIKTNETVDLECRQYQLTATTTGHSENSVRHIVEEWIYRHPLKHLKSCRYDGVTKVLKECKAKGLKIGVLSDYPSQDKIAALGLASYITLYLSSTDSEINILKPNPTGIFVACKNWGITPEQLLYVGDRMDTDGVAAQRAGAFFFHFQKNSGALELWISKHI
jgi:HAD superfamily hydrolase (TIGR01549 family)